MERGINKVVLASGETAYQAVALIKNNYVYLGWWTTPQLALKAFKTAEGIDVSND